MDVNIVFIEFFLQSFKILQTKTILNLPHGVFFFVI
jgi:hypothetical protein